MLSQVLLIQVFFLSYGSFLLLYFFSAKEQCGGAFCNELKLCSNSQSTVYNWVLQHTPADNPLPPSAHCTAGVPLVVVRPGRQGEKQVARLSDTAVPRAGQAALEEHRAVTSSRGGRENSARHKDFRGGSGPTSCLLAMKRHGPFSSPGHVRDHEPFLIHWDRAIPQPGYPQP